MLQLDKVGKEFGGLTAVADVTLHVKERTIQGIIGPNGAGKTTVFNLVTGVFPPNRGKIIFLGRDVTFLKPEVIACLGIARTFQQPHLLKSFTVLENVMLGLHYRTRSEFFACGFMFPGAIREEKQIRESALGYLDMFGLADMGERLASRLPMGQQRYLEVARALATRPRLLLLDEPMTGLNEQEADDFQRIICKVRDTGVTILVIEHHMNFVVKVCDEVMVLNFGAKIAEGTPREIQNSPEVIEAYLGTEEEID